MTDRAKYWQRMLTAWEASGLTQAEFCRRRGLKAVTFAWWKRQLVGPSKRGRRDRRSGGRDQRSRVHEGAGAGRGTGSFVEVALTEAASRPGDRAGMLVGAGYEVALPCGTTIRLPADFDVGRASGLISAVARPC